MLRDKLMREEAQQLLEASEPYQLPTDRILSAPYCWQLRRCDVAKYWSTACHLMRDIHLPASMECINSGFLTASRRSPFR